MCHIVGIEPQFKNIILNFPYVPITSGVWKPEAQWTNNKRKTTDLDQRLKKSYYDFQDSPDNEDDTRSSQEYMNDIKLKFHERALLAKSKRFFKKDTQRFSGAKATDKTYCFKCGRTRNFDEEEVSSDDNEMFEVKVLMAFADDESGVVGKESARNGEWVKLSIIKVHTLLEMKE
ncbi:hypothetical protein Tco_1413175 [Tanacetum coccineum]